MFREQAGYACILQIRVRDSLISYEIVLKKTTRYALKSRNLSLCKIIKTSFYFFCCSLFKLTEPTIMYTMRVWSTEAHDFLYIRKFLYIYLLSQNLWFVVWRGKGTNNFK